MLQKSFYYYLFIYLFGFRMSIKVFYYFLFV
jgi:hypothetical protein